jgi:hypothetical protein
MLKQHERYGVARFSIVPKIALALITVLSASIARSQHAKVVELDRFGGTSVAVSNPTGHFRLAKIGNRWMFVTPSGGAFWMFGVWNVIGDDHPFPSSSSPSYSQLAHSKYGDVDLHWGPQQVRRLKSWGFNTIGPYSVSWVTPTQADDHWPGDHTQPVKAPYVFLGNVSWYSLINSRNFGPRPTKDLIAGVKPDILGYYGGNFPDVFDPAFDEFVAGMLQGDPAYQVTKNSPWVVGYMSADTDNMWGFGAGPDFPTTPPGHAADHLGLVVLLTAPTQSSNPKLGMSYTDTQVYAKKALADFLEAKYSTIQALNTSWSSSYSTFGSAGGWGTGTGLLDESGNMRHKWLGRDTIRLSDFRPNVVSDLNAFLIQLSRKYFTVCRTRIKQFSPNALYFGNSVLGAWLAPPRKEILEGASGLLDAMGTNVDPGNRAQIDFVEQYLGDVPLIKWTGWRANPDSDMYGAPRQTDFQTQAERAAAYTRAVENMWSATASSTSSNPFVGLLWWEFHDNVAESSNWGLVSMNDNAYDGIEAVQAKGHDSWGFSTGGELRNYGDFLSGVRAANHEVYVRLEDETRLLKSGKQDQH